MWSEVMTFLGGLVVGGVSREVLERRGSRMLRRAARDVGLDAHLQTKFEDVWAGTPAAWISQYAFFPEAAPTESPPKARRDWIPWVQEHGGYGFGEQVVAVTLVANADVAVVVSPPRVEVLETWSVEGQAIALIAGGGAEITPRGYDVDLGAFGHVDPLVSPTVDPGGRLESTQRAYSLSRNQVERFDIRVHSAQPLAYRWKIAIDVLVDGTSVTLDPHPRDEPYLEFVGGDRATSTPWR